MWSDRRVDADAAVIGTTLKVIRPSLRRRSMRRGTSLSTSTRSLASNTLGNQVDIREFLGGAYLEGSY